MRQRLTPCRTPSECVKLHPFLCHRHLLCEAVPLVLTLCCLRRRLVRGKACGAMWWSTGTGLGRGIHQRVQEVSRWAGLGGGGTYTPAPGSAFSVRGAYAHRDFWRGSGGGLCRRAVGTGW